MVEPNRGERLEDAILRLMKRGRRPLSALALTARIAREGRVVPASMVFRAIRKLIARGSIRKVHVARAYAIGGEAAGISLVCGKCARLSEVPGGDVLRALERIASAGGFSASRYVIEVLGTCSACKGQGAHHRSRHPAMARGGAHR
jgi:Fur family zinc uptake transcriptional regulator